MTTYKANRPLPKRNTGEIRGFGKQVKTEGRVRWVSHNGSAATLFNWYDAEHRLTRAETSEYFNAYNLSGEVPRIVTIEHEMEDYEVTTGTGDDLTNVTKQRKVRGDDGWPIVKSISLISPTEWFSTLMKMHRVVGKSRQVQVKDEEGNTVMLTTYNGKQVPKTTYEYYNEYNPVTIHEIIGIGRNGGVQRILDDLSVMVTARQGYPFVNYITTGQRHTSNCGAYGAKTPWTQIQGGDFNRNYQYNVNYYKRNNQRQVTGELDEEFMRVYGEWKALFADLTALKTVVDTKQINQTVDSAEKRVAKLEGDLTKIQEKWTEEYMMEFARKERDKQIKQVEQNLKYRRADLERYTKRQAHLKTQDTTSVTAFQKKHFGKVFKKANVEGLKDADN